jgi:poly(3-hydroxyalkanoate) synthetase
LWRYRNDGISVSPPLLIVYSLFNRSYILDLAPGNSSSNILLNAGFAVRLLDWGCATISGIATVSSTTWSCWRTSSTAPGPAWTPSA